MNGPQDEEESLCLLASDLQESQTPAPNPKSKKTRENKVGDQKHYSNNAHSDCDIGEDCWDDDDIDDDDDNQEASFLSQGTAEKAFFNVCKTNDEEEEEEDDCVEVVTSFWSGFSDVDLKRVFFSRAVCFVIFAIIRNWLMWIMHQICLSKYDSW